MFLSRFVTNLKREKRIRRVKSQDIVAEQVRKVLSDGDQRLILMVRG